MTYTINIITAQGSRGPVTAYQIVDSESRVRGVFGTKERAEKRAGKLITLCY